MALASNSVEGKAEPFLKRVEALHGDLDSLRGKYMSDAKAIREDIKEVLAEAKEAGVPKKALKGLIQYRELVRKQEAIADGLDDEDTETYETLVAAFGDLGAAAAKRAGKTPANGETAGASQH